MSNKTRSMEQSITVTAEQYKSVWARSSRAELGIALPTTTATVCGKGTCALLIVDPVNEGFYTFCGHTSWSWLREDGPLIHQ